MAGKRKYNHPLLTFRLPDDAAADITAAEIPIVVSQVTHARMGTHGYAWARMGAHGFAWVQSVSTRMRV